MSTEETMSIGDTKSVSANSVVIRVEAGESTMRSVGRRILVAVLMASVFMNMLLLLSTAVETTSTSQDVQQSHHSGNESAAAKLAVINFSGTIMPPFTRRWLTQIEEAQKDDAVKGVLLAIDSPGGLVADSHQLYHELQKLAKKKPIYVAMKRLAASGGYYLAMGIGTEGRIFAEPTTWTGSIGVIIPRYNAAEFASKIGVTAEPLVTGPLKGSLNPFRDLSELEQEVWDAILKDSFDRFVGVIEQNRATLDDEQVRKLATGQIYTTSQAVENGLVDEVGYEEEALEALAKSLGLSEYEVIEYSTTPTLLDVILSGAVQSKHTFRDELLSASVPKAMYYCSWNPWVPAYGD
ncbi:MAG: signal peptide peptidase SppA [Fuerstiella sp.]|jgi:protease IV|nr:signal peptide peptidase SppA [Fuerstiella sp.]